MRWVMALVMLLAACGVDSDVSRSVGARCNDKDDCDERCLPDSEAYPGGFCSVSCLSTDDCPGDTACVDDEGGTCLFRCTDDVDCEFMGPGWECTARDELPDGTELVMVCRG